MSREEKISQGLAMSFMVMLSAQPGLTFVASNDLLKCFPYDEYEVVATRNEFETVYMLERRDSKAH